MEVINIHNKIYEIRGQRVMLDFDLAALYQNIRNGMTIVSNPGQGGMWSQTVTTSNQRRREEHLPYAFTEHGVTMLASVLRSEKAVKMSIAVVRAFISLKDYVIKQNAVTEQLQELRDRLGEHDVQLNSIYDAIENLLDEKEEKKNWEDRPRIGFKK